MERSLIKDTVKKVGEKVLLFGWIKSLRKHGKITFLDLYDRSGLVQAVDLSGSFSYSNEDVIEVTGTVKKRPPKMINPKLETGEIEIEIENLKVLSSAKPMPFPLDTDGYEINEEMRLKYRYLDLRRQRLTKNIRLRSAFVQYIRDFLLNHYFVEIETPLLTKSTPEGSRDFLVPSRLQQGKFYALPQSPQQYKQLLMAAGFERYFQIAKCLRDEDLRADRSFEHTQIDLEMSFVGQKEVMAVLEEMMIAVFEKMGQKIKQKPFPVFTYQQAMEKFGSDKFDLRSEEDKKAGVKAFAWVTDFPFFEKDKEGQWTFTHNPFSNPKPEFIEDLLKKRNIEKILTSQYDLVCDGHEVGGGSIRSSDPKVLEAVFTVMGYKTEEIKKQFGHMLEAFSYGIPPHGGCAFGIDRLMMILTNEKYIREVVAFPQTSGGKTAVMEAPNEISSQQLAEVGLQSISFATLTDAFSKIKNLLDKNKIKYQIYKHQAVYTSKEAAKVRNTSLHQGAKALIMFADSKSIMLVLPADLKVDFKKFKAIYKVKDLRIATAEEVKKLTAVAIGAVPPFGHIFNMSLYIDEHLFENNMIVFNAGLHTHSIEMKAADYKKVSQGDIGNFSSSNTIKE